VYISHRLEEIFEIADRVTVMRDGKVITTLDVSGITTSDLIQYMIGRELKEAYPLSRSIIGNPLLSVENLTGDVVQDVSFTLQAGEILGIAGLVGAGRSEILRMLFGVDPVHDGSIFVNKQEVKPRSPEEAISCGFALVPEERRTQGLITSRSVKENITLVHLNSFTSYGILINQAQESRVSEKISNDVQLRAHSQQQRVAQLSGGNQQKVVFAKWLLGDAQVLMLDEPTRGVDVGARFEIYNIIRDLAAKGTGILLISSDLHELLGIADRLLVMREGELVTTLPVTADLSQETILTYYYGGDYGHSPKTDQ
jgi:ribose transport system ATP-binding protein